jgi:hypothetical protein
MVPRTEIIGHQFVNSVEQLASFLKPGDVFRKLHSRIQYKFRELKLNERQVVCENLETHVVEEIYYNMPVYRLMFL